MPEGWRAYKTIAHDRESQEPQVIDVGMLWDGSGSIVMSDALFWNAAMFR